MEEKKVEELDLQELKKLCRTKNIVINSKDTKEILIAKLKDYSSTMINRKGKLTNIASKMKNKKLVIVSKNDPEDMRDSMLAVIRNATGSYEYPIIFNKKIRLPEPFIKNLQAAKVQRFDSIIVPNLGPSTRAYEINRYNVQIIEE